MDWKVCGRGLIVVTHGCWMNAGPFIPLIHPSLLLANTSKGHCRAHPWPVNLHRQVLPYVNRVLCITPTTIIPALGSVPYLEE